MASRYELWKKDDLGQSRGKPIDGPFYVIDSGMAAAIRESRGTHKKQVWDDKIGRFGGYNEIDLPNVVVLVERGDKQSFIRGFGIGGKWHVAVDCKRCNGSGVDVNHWGFDCKSCSGAGFKHRV